MPTEMETIAMTKGGARNRSGPLPSEDSARSEARGYKLDSLPVEGFKGEAPEFPLPQPTKRELDVWAWAWTTPQACAWSLPSEAWRQHTVALWVRTKVRCEDLEAPSSLIAQLHRLADQIGMTTAGLAEMGWKITADAKPDSTPEPAKAAPGGSRLRALNGGLAG